MNKDLRKVVILLAHPNIKASQANKALIDAVSDIEGVAVFNLYELSEDIAFNVDEWSKIISDTSAVIYQFPFYWMSAPSLLKKWQDEVFTFLSKTPAVAGKPLMVVTTTGSEYEAYRSGGRNRFTFAPLSGKCNPLGHGMADPHCDIWNGNRGCGKEHCRRSELVQTKSRNAY